MKKILFVLLPLVFMTLLSATHLTPAELKGALDISYDGDFVTRAIMNNDLYENNGGWLDNRLRLDLYAKLGDKFGLGWNPQVGYNIFTDVGSTPTLASGDPGIVTRELYMDYNMDLMQTKIRMGRQYWCDHRSLILDDYFAGITADMKVADFDAEFGFIKIYEGLKEKLDDQHAVFAGVAGTAPIEWGATLMFGQNHDVFPPLRTADIWFIPYAGMTVDPIHFDATLVVNNQMYKDAGKDKNETGIGVAVKAGVDMGVKLGADLLYVTKEGINSYSPYYENGLYLFGNKLDYDGVQFVYNPYNSGEACISMVLSGSYPLNEQMEVFGAVGMVTLDDPMGMELNAGMNYKLAEGITLCPVMAIGQTGKALEASGDGDENMVYMLGGLIKAEF